MEARERRAQQRRDDARKKAGRMAGRASVAAGVLILGGFLSRRPMLVNFGVGCALVACVGFLLGRRMRAPCDGAGAPGTHREP